MRYQTFSTLSNNQLAEPMFFGNPVNVSRYDQQKYVIFEKLIEKQLSFFWRPEEIDVTIDGVQYSSLNQHEKHIFLSNLKYQTLMDSIQGRSPNILFLPIASIPELETWVETWSFSETVHSRSYTHIIRGIETKPDMVFNDIVANNEIRKRAQSISRYYDELYRMNIMMESSEMGHDCGYRIEDHMRALYMALNAVNALEGIRFYVSFACSFAFAERELMEGNAKIIKLIARDEMLHLVGTQNIIRIMSDGRDGTGWQKIATECSSSVRQLFLDVVHQEIEWTKYLFKDGSILGLNEQILTNYVMYLADTRMKAIGMEPEFHIKTHPIPWVETWFDSDSVQVAPQEVEVSSYLTNQINTTIDKSDLMDIEL